MRDRDLHALEFDSLLRLLADYVVSPAGKAACLALRPQTDERLVKDDSRRTWQCFRLTEVHGSLPLGSFPDIRPTLDRVGPDGVVVDGRQLVDVLAVIEAARRLARFFRDKAADSDALHGYAACLPAMPQLSTALERCLDENGNLRDAASPTLRTARRRLHDLGRETEGRLTDLLRAKAVREVVADHYVTTRNDRFVIPVRPDFHARLPGIVQDRSRSGETLFVEPLSVVELNNRLLLARADVAAEERRLFLRLTALVREHHVQLAETFATLTDLDVLHAKVAFARTYGATPPRFGAAVQLRGATHPLLRATGKPVVPIDLLLPPETRGLVISGPNTGGKTAALKTLGLICLMAQTGLLLPVREEDARQVTNEVPIFRSIFADIGDAQSLQDDLSTFSAHVANINDLLANCVEPALILLDEPGGGTDPAEGGALATGLLHVFKERNVALLLATHLRQVKQYALADDRYRVASVAFDVDRLQPLYRLQYDVPGESLGLPVARRLGLPDEVCAAAEAALADDARRFSAALARMEDTSAKLERERTMLEAERNVAAELRERHARLLADSEEKLRKRWRDETAQASQFVRRVREEGRQALADLHEAVRAARTSRTIPARARQEFAQVMHAQDARIEEKRTSLQSHPTTDTPLPCVGDEVALRDGTVHGTLVAINGTKARVHSRGVTFEAPIARLRATTSRKPPPASVRVSVNRPAAGRPELNLLGLRVHDALPRLEVFLDRAVLNNQASVRIVHGLGSGALRRAVQDYLSDSAYCQAFNEAPHSEGGRGATVVSLNV